MDSTANSSITSGTVSSGYTSIGSQLSWMSMDAARHFQEMEMKNLEFETAIEKKMKQIKILSKQFFGASSSAKCNTEGGDLSVLERWFTELGVEWVLHVADGAPAGELDHALDASNWFPAFTEIMDIFHLISGLLPIHGSAEGKEPTTESKEQNIAKHLQLAIFTQQAMLKMLTFVDFIVASNLTREVFTTYWVLVNLHTLLRVREALSKAVSEILLPFDPSSSAEVVTILRNIVDVLSAKEGKVGKAIWSAVEGIRSRITESLEDYDQGSSSVGSSDIDEATKFVMTYVMVLEDYVSIMEAIASEAASLGKYVPSVGDVPPLTGKAMEMVSCLEQKLANKSQAFLDQGLRFLFLLNNSSFIADKLYYTPYFPESDKVEGNMKRYIQVSWAPVMSCLIDSTCSCLGENYQPLHKFESEFQKVYTTQKLWKVPSPKLRKRLRRAIIDEVIPGYTRYVADYYGNGPLKFSPSNLEEMLQELFEG